MICPPTMVAFLLAGALEPTPPPPDVVDLATVLKLAREASPRLALERQGIAAAIAERRTAGALPNPTLSYGLQHQPGEITNFSSRTAQSVSIDLPLLVAGQRGARVEAADQGVAAARARVAASGNGLAADAGAAFVQLLAAQKKLGLLGEGMEELDHIRDVVAGRQASGMASPYDLLRIDVEVASWRTRIAEAEAELAERRGKLAVLLGFIGWRPRPTGELRPLDVDAGAPAGAEHPAIATARREEAMAQASTVVAERERFPGVSLSGGMFWTSDPFGATYSLGVAVELPILDSRGGALDRARAEADAASLRRRLVEAEIEADVALYAVQVAQRASALQHFQRQVEPRLSGLRQMAEDAYRLGRSSIIELLDALRTRHETQTGHLELVAGLVEAQLRLRAARGEFAARSNGS